MLGDRAAVVLEIRRFDIHGVAHADVVIAFDDGVRTTARLGAESVPDAIEAGDPVVARLVMSTVVALERPDGA